MTRVFLKLILLSALDIADCMIFRGLHFCPVARQTKNNARTGPLKLLQLLALKRQQRLTLCQY